MTLIDWAVAGGALLSVCCSVVLYGVLRYFARCASASIYLDSQSESNASRQRLRALVDVVRCPWCPGFQPFAPEHQGVSHTMCQTCFLRLIAESTIVHQRITSSRSPSGKETIQ